MYFLSSSGRREYVAVRARNLARFNPSLLVGEKFFSSVPLEVAYHRLVERKPLLSGKPSRG